MMPSLLTSPHHRAGAILARIAVNCATLIWSIVLLSTDGTLAATPYGPALLKYAPEDAYGYFFGILSLGMLVRIWRKSAPEPLAIVGYAILLLAWGYVEIVMLLIQRPLYPTAVAWVSVGTALALYGFVANPRPRDAISG